MRRANKAKLLKGWARHQMTVKGEILAIQNVTEMTSKVPFLLDISHIHRKYQNISLAERQQSSDDKSDKNTDENPS